MTATVEVKLIPPLSFFLNVRLGGSLFNLYASVHDKVRISTRNDKGMGCIKVI